MFELYFWGTGQQKPNVQQVPKTVFGSGKRVRDKLLGNAIGRHYSTTSSACQSSNFNGCIPKWGELSYTSGVTQATAVPMPVSARISAVSDH